MIAAICYQPNTYEVKFQHIFQLSSIKFRKFFPTIQFVNNNYNEFTLKSSDNTYVRIAAAEQNCLQALSEHRHFA